MATVEILADSIPEDGNGARLTTVLLKGFPKILQAELNTHRALSKSSASSRAVPVQKMIQRVLDDPYIPPFTANQKGMQGEPLTAEDAARATDVWLEARNRSVYFAQWLLDMGVHKQDANRLLDPFLKVDIVISATEWENFFVQRCHPSTQPAFRQAAEAIRDALASSAPRQLIEGEWHMPFVNKRSDELPLKERLWVSVARCARASYFNFDGNFSLDEDLGLVLRLAGSEPRHMSPFEHCAVNKTFVSKKDSRNFDAPWMPFRSIVEISSAWLPPENYCRA